MSNYQTSGIYLTVWDNKSNKFNDILKPTKGGHPHITFAYTNKYVTNQENQNFAAQVFPLFALTNVELTDVYINSFQPGGLTSEKKQKPMRHDVLLSVDKKTCDKIRKERINILDTHPMVDKFFMRDPHITIGIYDTLKDAKKCLDRVKLLLPHDVMIGGIDIS
jgi:hypothetical protein